MNDNLPKSPRAALLATGYGLAGKTPVAVTTIDKGGGTVCN